MGCAINQGKARSAVDLFLKTPLASHCEGSASINSRVPRRASRLDTDHGLREKIHDGAIFQLFFEPVEAAFAVSLLLFFDVTGKIERELALAGRICNVMSIRPTRPLPSEEAVNRLKTLRGRSPF